MMGLFYTTLNFIESYYKVDGRGDYLIEGRMAEEGRG
jgi:hypothetical protein